MTTRISAISDSVLWKQAYLEAILERDSMVAIGRIRRAQHILSEREHELLAAGAPIENRDELEAISDAHYVLEAWLNSMPALEEKTEPLAR